MIIGIGIDIIEVVRVKRLFDEYGKRFVERVFTEIEIDYCEHMAHPAMHFAARFAAKEAFLKAIGTGLTGGISWREIGIINEDSGKPQLHYEGKAAEIAKKLGTNNTYISLSHNKEYATAIVVIENERI